MRPRFVFFDLDDTLVDDRRAQREAALQFQREQTPLQAIAEADFLQRWQHTSERHYQRYLAGECNFQEQRRARLRELFAGEALRDDDADRLFEIYRQLYEQSVCLFDDTIACLQQCAAWQLGVITNGEGGQQRRKLAACALAQRFQVLVISGELNLAKPDPAIFDAASEQAKTPPAACVYIGDRLDTDAQAAVAAGWHGVWLNRRDDRRAPDGVRTIHRLTDLASLLRL